LKRASRKTEAAAHRRVEGWGMVSEKIVGVSKKRTTTMAFKKIDGGAHVERWVMGVERLGAASMGG